jgi:hypothetical protein
MLYKAYKMDPQNNNQTINKSINISAYEILGKGESSGKECKILKINATVNQQAMNPSYVWSSKWSLIPIYFPFI